MGSKPSKAKRRSITVATKTTIIPIVSKTPQESRIPNEIIDEILNHLVADSSFGDDSLQKSLRSCSLVSISWIPSCRRHLFHTITFTSRNVAKWLETFPVPEESPAYHVKDLRFSLGGRCGAPEEFFKHTPWFTNAEKMTVTGNVMFPSLGIPLFARLPQSVTSLAIEAGKIDLMQMRDIMVHLPNLNDLVLSGTVVVRFRKLLPGLGTVLMGRFGGELRIWNGRTDEDFVNMLLEVPTGLHFTKLHIYANRACLLQTVRLAEACHKTLIELSYLGFIQDGQEPFERSFDFSESPKLQKVTFNVHWVHGPLHYIPIALSTLKPSTSPRLSYIHLSFSGPTHPSFFYFISGTSNLENLGNDLRRIADELSRIEREYGGTVDLSVFRTMGFGQLDTLNVLEHWDR